MPLWPLWCLCFGLFIDVFCVSVLFADMWVRAAEAVVFGALAADMDVDWVLIDVFCVV